MVTSPSPSASAGEERRRRVTMDRAKVSHLSRQLQLRLQYAKLKVEHGWHKQNLNEVENLYFRRSSSRPRQHSSCGLVPITQSSYSANQSAPPPPPPQSSLSFKVPTSNALSRSSDAKGDKPSDPHPPFSSPPTVLREVNTTSPSPAPDATVGPSPRVENSYKGDPTPSIPESSTNQSNTSAHPKPSLHAFPSAPQTSPPTQTISAVRPSFTIPLSARALQKQPVHSILPALTDSTQTRPVSVSSMPAYPASVSTPIVPTTPSFSPFTSSAFSGDSAASPGGLTYDSFWSSHNASTIAKRPLSFRSSFSSVLGSGSLSSSLGGGSGAGSVGSIPYSSSLSSVMGRGSGAFHSTAGNGFSSGGLVKRAGSETMIGTTGYSTATLGPPFAQSSSSGIANSYPMRLSVPVRVESVSNRQ